MENLANIEKRISMKTIRLAQTGVQISTLYCGIAASHLPATEARRIVYTPSRGELGDGGLLSVQTIDPSGLFSAAAGGLHPPRAPHTGSIRRTGRGPGLSVLRTVAALDVRLSEQQIERLNRAGDPSLESQWLR